MKERPRGCIRWASIAKTMASLAKCKQGINSPRAPPRPMSKLTTLLLAAAGLLLLLTQTGCAVSMPFRGPGYDRGKGVTAASADGTVVVALTRGVLDRSKRRPFDRATGDVADGMGEVPGLVGYSFRRELLGKRVWTMTVWESQQALVDFVRSPLHRAAMGAGAEATEEFLFHSVRVPKDDIPLPWSEAARLVADEGTAYPDFSTR